MEKEDLDCKSLLEKTDLEEEEERNRDEAATEEVASWRRGRDRGVREESCRRVWLATDMVGKANAVDELF